MAGWKDRKRENMGEYLVLRREDWVNCGRANYSDWSKASIVLAAAGPKLQVFLVAKGQAIQTNLENAVFFDVKRSFPPDK